MPNVKERLIPYSVPPILYVQMWVKKIALSSFIFKTLNPLKKMGLFTAACGGI